MERIKLFSFLLLAFCTFASKAQDTRNIKGRVLDAADGNPIGGALVSTAEIDGYSGLTDEDGLYSLTIPVYASQLLISAPDYSLSRQGIATSAEQADVRLFSTSFSNYYQSQTLPTSNPQTLRYAFGDMVNVESDIQRNLGAYLHSVSRSGVPGLGFNMFVGGLGSINAIAQPLVVIDDVIIDPQYERQMLHEGFYNDILSNIDPDDIEHISLLRDGTALYGAKGANGVILIQTRRNHSMATRITATITTGLTTQPKFMETMSAEQYRSYASELLKTTGTKISDFKFLNNNPSYYYYGQFHNDTDWKDDVYRNAMQNHYGINVEGGDDVANYNLSLGYTSSEATANHNEMNRLNIRFNADVSFTSKLSLRFDASYVNQKRNLRDDGAPSNYDEGTPTSPTFLAYVKSPFLSPYSYTGGVIADNHLDVADENYLDEALSGYRNYNYRLANPYALNEYGDAENKNHFENAMLNVSITPRYQFIPNLSVSEHFSYNLINANEKYYIPLSGVPDYYVTSLASTCHNEVSSLFAKENSLSSDTRVTWNRRFEAHNLSLWGGARVNYDEYNVKGQLGYNTGSDKTPFISSSLFHTETSGTTDKRTNIAWYAQANYDYLQRYYLQLNLTAETSSRFGKHTQSGIGLAGVRWGLFPSAQLGWVISAEPWMAGQKSINYLKLNIGYDESGNDNIDCNASCSYLMPGKYLNKIVGISLENIGNSQIQWERSRRMNVSIEGNFFGDLLHLDARFYHAKTDNLLMLGHLSTLTGLESNWCNSGALQNTGFDLMFCGRLINTKNWQWEIGASVGHYQNEVTHITDTQDYIDNELYGATIRSAVGASANAFYGYRTQGVFATFDEATASHLYIKDKNGIDKTYFKAGDVHFSDLNGDGCIDQTDRTEIGDPNPTIFGNVFTSLSYRRLRLDVNLNYAVGQDVFNYLRQQLESGSRFMNQTTTLTRRWHGEGHVTDVPMITFQDPMGNSRFSDRWIEDGSYLKVKGVTLSYQLPLQYQFLQGLVFWVQGNNLFTFSNYFGSDPETSFTTSVIGQGIDIGLLPQSRSFVFGIKINL